MDIYEHPDSQLEKDSNIKEVEQSLSRGEDIIRQWGPDLQQYITETSSPALDALLADILDIKPFDDESGVNRWTHDTAASLYNKGRITYQDAGIAHEGQPETQFRQDDLNTSITRILRWAVNTVQDPPEAMAAALIIEALLETVKKSPYVTIEDEGVRAMDVDGKKLTSITFSLRNGRHIDAIISDETNPPVIGFATFIEGIRRPTVYGTADRYFAREFNRPPHSHSSR